MLYVSASPNTEDANKRIDVIEKCCVDINSWMACNYMKLNTDKTEVLCIGTPANLKKVPIVRVNIVSHEIVASQHLKNLGVIFDCNLKYLVMLFITCILLVKLGSIYIPQSLNSWLLC